MTLGRSLLLRAEVGLTAVTVAAVLGMGRLFDGNAWVKPLVINAVLAHITVAVCRRRGLGLLTTASVSVPAAALAVTWVSYLSTTTLGIPTGRTWSAMGDDLSDAWAVYQEVVAPAPVLTGFVLASAVVLWAVAYVADWAAFRLWVPFEATLAAGTLFLFTALLGTSAGRELAVGAFAASVIGFMLLHRMARQDGTSHWVAERRDRGQRWLLVAGGSLGVVAVVAGTIFGPTLPGAGSTGVLDPRELRVEDPRVTISPLVDIRSRLVKLRDTEVFQVRSPEPAYWRLTSLERFDGVRWTSSGSYSKAEGDLPDGADTTAATASFDQTFVISALDQIWLPSAFEPQALEVEGVEVRYDEGSATLIVDRDVDTSDGLVYTVTSSSPRITAADLTGAAGDLPGDIVDTYTQLDNVSDDVRQLAATITADADTPYAKALALQDHLRQFTYDLTVEAGHSDDHLRRFLFETRRGYCEQFAGAFAAMARSLGIPARVAVGFTQGEQDAVDPTLFHVRGEHAHAWPEVFMAGAGWVAFEPTPGRGMPFAEPYTGVRPAQAETGNPGGVDQAPTTTAPASGDSPIPSQPQGSLTPPDLEQAVAAGGDDTDEDSLLVRWVLRPLLIALALAALLMVLYLLTFPAVVWLSRRRRQRGTTTPAERISLTWTQAHEELAILGLRPSAVDTPAEAARSMTDVLQRPDAVAAIRGLARSVEESSYSAAGADELAAELAEESLEPIREAVRTQATRWELLRPWVDPRPHLERRRQVHRSQQRRITNTVRGDMEVERELTVTGDRR